MSNITTATIDPVLVQLIEAMRRGGHEIDLAVVTAPDGTKTHTISIRPAAPLAPAPAEPREVTGAELPAPVPTRSVRGTTRNMPGSVRGTTRAIRTYCPDCGQCTASRKAKLTGWTPQRCEEHSRCFQCKAILTAAERFSCTTCQGESPITA